MRRFAFVLALCVAGCGGDDPSSGETGCDITKATGRYLVQLTRQSGDCDPGSSAVIDVIRLRPAFDASCTVTSSETNAAACSAVFGFNCPVGGGQMGSYGLAIEMTQDGDVIQGVQVQEVLASSGASLCRSQYGVRMTRQ